jgi:molybdate transport system regulatory protein
LRLVYAFGHHAQRGPSPLRCRTMTTRTRTPTVAARPRDARAPVRGKPQMRFRMRITDGGEVAVGPGKIALLEAVERTGSITAAAKTLDMSYRRAWLLLDALNRSLRRPAVESVKGGQHGGGCELTAVGRELIALYRRIEQEATVACRSDIRRLMGLLSH